MLVQDPWVIHSSAMEIPSRTAVLLLVFIPSISALCFEFAGDSFLTFDDGINITESAHYKLSIKTTTTYGNIYFARGAYFDFERLYLENGVLHYFLFNPTRYGVGGTFGIHVKGLGVLDNGNLGPVSIADDRWHTVEFFRNTRLPGMNHTSSGIVLDGQKNVDSRQRKDVAIKPPFYVGGSAVHEAFQGVIKDFEEVRNNFIFHETSQPMNVKRYREPPC